MLNSRILFSGGVIFVRVNGYYGHTHKHYWRSVGAIRASIRLKGKLSLTSSGSCL